MRDIRKHIAWYPHGFPAGSDLRRALAPQTPTSSTGCSRNSTATCAFPTAAHGPRGRQGSAATVSLPEGWLSDPTTAPCRPMPM